MAWYHGTGRWLTENQYRRIKRKALQMGAEDVCLTAINHAVDFKHTVVVFAFKPFMSYAYVKDSGLGCGAGSFINQETADKIQENMDVAVKFMEYLKSFNKEVEETK